MKNYYLDLDGFIMKYERDIYREKEGETPVWLRKNEHYFRTLEPDNWALQFVYNLIGYIQTHTNEDGTHDNVYILTNVLYGPMFNEHFHDKILRTRELIPQIPLENILISVGDKNDCAEFITDHELTEDDILIDDYNPNLNKWVAAGGTGWKYCNGENNPLSYDGLCIGKMFDTVEATLQNVIMLTHPGQV